jgi:hypothetical protein
VSLELENEVLSNLILEPARMESNEDLSEELFSSTKNRRLFCEISRIFEEYRPQSIDEGVLAELSETTRAEILEFMKGACLMSPGNFNLKVLHLKRERLIRQLYGTVNVECEQQLKTGLWTPDALDKAFNLMAKIRGLDCGDPNQSFSPLSKFETKHVDWLWHGRIPRGMLTIIAGDPGLGKSFLCTWLAARLSRGETLPDNAELKEIASSVILSAEDSPSHALRPRAEANGADLSRIFCMEDSAFDIAADLRRLDALSAADPAIKLVVIDPLNSYLGRVDYLKDPDVRTALRPLTEFAEARQIATVAVMHLNKKQDLDGIYRIGGSIGFAGLARSILAVTKDGDDEERRLLLPLKMNYVRKPSSLAFWIHDDLRLSFDTNPVDADVEEALSPLKRQTGADKTHAARWLTDFLADGPQDLKNILRVAESEGHSRSAVFRAKAMLPIESRASGFRDQRSSSWQLAEKE